MTRQHKALSFVALALCFAFMFSLCSANCAFTGKISDDMYIRVGLYFGSKTAGQYKMQSAEGFNLVIFDEATYDKQVFRSVYATNATATSNGSVVNVSFDNGESYSNPFVYIEPIGFDDNRGLIKVPSGKEFCGMLRFTAENSRLTVLNILKLEDYVKGVLPNEVPPSWDSECLNAAAVAARTFVLSSLGGKHRSMGIDVCDTICCQVFNGTGSEFETTNQAVDNTKSQILIYDGKPIQALYHSSSGGSTESAAGAFGGNEESFPYLTVVETPFEKYEEYPAGKWLTETTTKEILDFINSKSAYSGKLKGDIESIECTAGKSGYVQSVTVTDIHGNQLTVKTSSNVYSLFSKFTKSANFVLHMGEKLSSVNVNGNDVVIDPEAVSVMTSEGVVKRSIVGDRCVIRSTGLTRADITTFTEGDGTVIFDGKGFGHGVGLSQYGSRELARMGKSYDEILAIYYPGTELTTMSAVFEPDEPSEQEAESEVTEENANEAESADEEIVQE